MITAEMIPQIEKAFGFELYDWQRDYFLDNPHNKPTDRRSGRTWSYCVKLLLCREKPIQLRRRSDLFQFVDSYHGDRYLTWFADYLLEINQILIDNGFKTCIERIQ